MTSALHGLRSWEIDPSGIVIRGLEKLGLVWDVVRIDPERQAFCLLFTSGQLSKSQWRLIRISNAVAAALT